MKLLVYVYILLHLSACAGPGEIKKDEVFIAGGSEDAVVIFGGKSVWVYPDGSKSEPQSIQFDFISFDPIKKKYGYSNGFRARTHYKTKSDSSVNTTDYFIRRVPQGYYALKTVQSGTTGTTFPLLKHTNFFHAEKGKITYVGNILLESSEFNGQYRLNINEKSKDAQAALTGYKSIKGDMITRPFKSTKVDCGDIDKEIIAGFVDENMIRKHCSAPIQ